MFLSQNQEEVTMTDLKHDAAHNEQHQIHLKEKIMRAVQCHEAGITSQTKRASGKKESMMNRTPWVVAAIVILMALSILPMTASARSLQAKLLIEQVQKVTPSDAATDEFSASSVAIAADVALVATSLDSLLEKGNVGSVYVFARKAGKTVSMDWRSRGHCWTSPSCP
ncbi:FG-GAP repeat protein [Candidatus Acetothermia bacterium]|nr:FG-GAP repeat protein [Candidatus Acetothermia bacterium]